MMSVDFRGFHSPWNKKASNAKLGGEWKWYNPHVWTLKQQAQYVKEEVEKHQGAPALALTDLDVSKNQLGAAACSALLLPAAAAAARATTHSAGVTAVAEGLKRLNLFGARTIANNRYCVSKRSFCHRCLLCRDKLRSAV
jgi:hypothetical protein